MGRLVDEVREWNSPAIGAYLLWRFTNGYYKSHSTGEAPVALLHFLAIPILTSKRLLDPVNDRRPDLQSYVRSFESEKDSDLLLAIHDRAHRLRKHTLAAIDLAVTAGLLAWDIKDGKLYPAADVKRPSRGKSPKKACSQLGKKAEILGKWFGQHTVQVIARYLKVVL